MSPSRLCVLIILLAAVGAFAFRLPFLDLRPMHGDEANQAVKTGILLETGEYRYDPHDHHGPTLYYLALFPAWLTGAQTLSDLNESSLRIVPMLFGVALVLLMWPYARRLGYLEAAIAALMLAVIPAFVFYSDYYIQEMLLVFFSAAFLLAGWRFMIAPDVISAVGLGAFAALMHATKETAVLAWAAAVAGAMAVLLLQRRDGVSPAVPSRRYVSIAAFSAIVIWLTMYSSFFTHARGPLDSILTYGNYLQRADGAGLHDKPWYHYLGLLAYTHRGPGPIWSDALVLVFALIGLCVAWRGRPRDEEGHLFLRFIAAYTIVLTAMYSIIPYKTPWSMLSFYFGVVLLAATGAAWFIRLSPRLPVRAVLALPLAACLIFAAFRAHTSVATLPADPRNPYVYAHTSTAHLQMIERFHNIAAVHPDGNDLRVYVIQPDRDYWPLPWYLRDFSQVGYFDAIPEPPDADVLVIAPRLYPELEERLEHEYMGMVGGLRPNVLRTVLIRQEWWDAFMEPRR